MSNYDEANCFQLQFTEWSELSSFPNSRFKCLLIQQPQNYPPIITTKDFIIINTSLFPWPWTVLNRHNLISQTRLTSDAGHRGLPKVVCIFPFTNYPLVVTFGKASDGWKSRWSKHINGGNISLLVDFINQWRVEFNLENIRLNKWRTTEIDICRHLFRKYQTENNTCLKQSEENVICAGCNFFASVQLSILDW